MQRLCLRQNQIGHIAFPSDFGQHLEELDLYDNAISHIKNLGDSSANGTNSQLNSDSVSGNTGSHQDSIALKTAFPNLKTLDLSFNKIKHIKRVNHLKSLTDLFFVQNKISKIEGLEGLEELRNLELGANRIRVRILLLHTAPVFSRLIIDGAMIRTLRILIR